MEEKRTFTVFSMKLAGHLMTLGFVLEDIGINRRDSNKRVYFFKNTEELQNAISAYNQK